METITIDVQQTQPSLADLLSLLAKGEEVVLTEKDKPLARMISLTSDAKPRVAGLHLEAMQMSDDFDEPLRFAFL